MRTDAYRLRDVEAATAEAVPSQKDVARALAELEASPNAVEPSQPASQFRKRVATRVSGTSQRTCSVSRVILAAPRDGSQAVGRIL